MLTTISYPAFGLHPVLLRKMQVSFILTRSVHLSYDCVWSRCMEKNAAGNSEKAVNQLNF